MRRNGRKTRGTPPLLIAASRLEIVGSACPLPCGSRVFRLSLTSTQRQASKPNAERQGMHRPDDFEARSNYEEGDACLGARLCARCGCMKREPVQRPRPAQASTTRRNDQPPSHSRPGHKRIQHPLHVRKRFYEGTMKNLLRIFEESMKKNIDLSSAYRNIILIFEEWSNHFKMVNKAK